MDSSITDGKIRISTGNRLTLKQNAIDPLALEYDTLLYRDGVVAALIPGAKRVWNDALQVHVMRVNGYALCQAILAGKAGRRIE